MALEQDDVETHIPVDEDDDDSAYGDDVLSDTTSIASTIYRHRFENGRRYHKYQEGSYWGPNDDLQNDQLDIAHHMLRVLLNGKLYLSPVQDPQMVLDVGTGTGIWAIDFADEHPEAEVVGVDLSPIQPEFVPPNCKFEVDDINAPWTYPENYFDMVHVRCMFGSIDDWPNFYREVFDHLKPGGWIETLEMDIQFKADDGTCPPDHIQTIWSKTFIEAGELRGKTFRNAFQAKQWITDAGFEEVVQHRWKLPSGPWSSDPKLKELGNWNFLHCYQGAEGWGLFLLTNVLKWSLDEARVFIAKFRNSLKEKKTHSYFEVVHVHARKPFSRPPGDAKP
ncbi:S-adenosyl-L-methionine-dependent methyltransferase [Aulographum hederae CBS 113979]|uniref:S-adenosyl-L-methionine-dependent methyltransferase n=1 Tax=Aulographum hederae CBS 113979 TaxID=1176131 RepID=A0A6G1GXE6_9PEZI|nr:S-adenosyl-L-methionine-dependent methyltransferase [Aulographum hederae CBS 113979]